MQPAPGPKAAPLSLSVTQLLPCQVLLQACRLKSARSGLLPIAVPFAVGLGGSETACLQLAAAPRLRFLPAAACSFSLPAHLWRVSCRQPASIEAAVTSVRHISSVSGPVRIV